MEDALTICTRCGWIHVDGNGDYCNGCGRSFGADGSGARTVARPYTRAAFGADLAFALLIVGIIALLVAAAT